MTPAQTGIQTLRREIAQQAAHNRHPIQETTMTIIVEIDFHGERDLFRASTERLCGP
jgi:hypothetical protein